MKIKVVSKKLGRERAMGQAHKSAKLIEIDPRLKPKEDLETTVHEVLHVVRPELDETAVDNAGMVIANILWKRGYRRVNL